MKGHLGPFVPVPGLRVFQPAPVPAAERHPAGRKVRLDALPENIVYVDSGCVVAPRCLECPLDRCRFEVPVGKAQGRFGREAVRWLRVRELKAEGRTVSEIARETNASRRTVFRALARP